MQAVPLLRICAVNATDGINGYPLSLALLRKALDSDLNVCSLLFLHLQKDVPSLFKHNSRFTAVECLDVTSLEEIRQRLNRQNLSHNSLIFIDSLSVLIDQFSLPSTSWFLTQISELAHCVLVLGHNLEEEDWRRIESIAAAVFELERKDGGRLPVCKTTTKRKNGTAESKLEEYSVSDDYSLQVRPFIEQDQAMELIEQAMTSSSKSESMAGNNDDLDKLPFDIGLNLSERERQAKASVHLPFMAAQTQKGLVGLNISSGKKVRAGGQIVYTPDQGDDFDESDPDDDLTI